MAREYYDILGLEENATQEEIKIQYKRRAGKYHPDKISGNSEVMQKLNRAYACLSDAHKKSKYDETGTDDPNELTLHQQAANIFMTEIANLLTSYYKGDFIKKAKQEISSKLLKIHEQKQKIESNKAFLEFKLTRIKCNKGEDLIKAILDRNLMALSVNLKLLSEAIEYTTLARDICDNYTSSDRDIETNLFGLVTPPIYTSSVFTV
jgi:curved DNA-binding protein CbpA